MKFTKRYTRKKWYRTSRDLLQWAASFDAEVAAKPLDYVVKKLGASADAKPRPSARAA